MNNFFITEKELYLLLDKKRTALWGLRKRHKFPEPVLTHPSRYNRKAVMEWLENGGINQCDGY